MNNSFTHKILCKCDEIKGKHSNTRGVYRAYKCKSKIILKCKTCNKKKEYIVGGEIIHEQRFRHANETRAGE